MNFTEDIKKVFTQSNVLMRLIYINIAAFISINIPVLIGYLFAVPVDFGYWVSAPASIPVLLTKPWTIITYMFVHADIMHILFNMLFLYWFGIIFIQYFNQRQLLNLYFMGGLFGVLFYIVTYNIFPVFLSLYYKSELMGASAAAMGIMIATALRVPDHRINLFMIWPIKIKYLAAFLVALDIFTIPKNNAGGHISHLGGAFAGYLFVAFLKKGTDITLWMNPVWDFMRSFFKPRSRLKVTYKRPKSDFEYNKQKADDSKKLDRILEKIKESGYDNLTREEKDFLFRQSK